MKGNRLMASKDLGGDKKAPSGNTAKDGGTTTGGKAKMSPGPKTDAAQKTVAGNGPGGGVVKGVRPAGAKAPPVAYYEPLISETAPKGGKKK